jgi:cytidylate kinase
MNKNISIAIDGPAGAGKSTVAKIIAESLKFEYIDTGSMYRAFTFKVLERGISVNDIGSIIQELDNTAIDFTNNHIYLDGEIVDKQIRENRISNNVSDISKIKEVRAGMVKVQQNIAKNKSIVMDGRDIGTVVLPNAEYKFFLNASLKERARRRYKELIEKGEKNLTVDKIEKEIERRDIIDSTREISPLVKSKDAYEIDTTNKTIDECVEEIINIIEGR